MSSVEHTNRRGHRSRTLGSILQDGSGSAGGAGHGVDERDLERLITGIEQL